MGQTGSARSDGFIPSVRARPVLDRRVDNSLDSGSEIEVTSSYTRNTDYTNSRMQKFLDSTREFLHTTAGELDLTEIIPSGELDHPANIPKDSNPLQKIEQRTIFRPESRKLLHPVVLSFEQIMEYEAAFKMYDANGDGVMSVNELHMLLTTIGLKPTEQEVMEMIASVDTDNDGCLSRCEFIKLMSRKHSPTVTTISQFEAIFKVFDTDGNGQISRTEFKDTLFSIGQRCSEDELSKLIDEIDTNKDGIISKREFLSVFLSNPNV